MAITFEQTYIYVIGRLYEERCIKNSFISNYFTLLHLVPQLRSPNRFPSMEFRAKFEVVLQKQFLSIIANHSTKLEFSTVN